MADWTDHHAAREAIKAQNEKDRAQRTHTACTLREPSGYPLSGESRRKAGVAACPNVDPNRTMRRLSRPSVLGAAQGWFSIQGSERAGGYWRIKALRSEATFSEGALYPAAKRRITQTATEGGVICCRVTSAAATPSR
jgi:hypothetical protein